MGAILGNRTYAIVLATVLALIAIFGLHSGAFGDATYPKALVLFLHVLSGIVWIGLLYYFNLVQIRSCRRCRPS